MAMLAIEGAAPMLALPFLHEAMLDSPENHPQTRLRVHPLRAGNIEPLLNLTLRGVLTSLDEATACRVWRFGTTLPVRIRGVVFAAVIAYAAPAVSQRRLETLPGWDELDSGSQLMLLTVGGAVSLFSGVTTPGVRHYSFAEFLATLRESRDELAERLAEAVERQAAAEREVETVRAADATVHGFWRLTPLCPQSGPAQEPSRAMIHNRAGIASSRQRLHAIEEFLAQAEQAALSEHAWQLDRAFAMMGQGTM